MPQPSSDLEKNMLKTLLTLALCAASSLTMAADLGAMHEKFGVKAEPADAECLACHGGTYAKLAESTRNLTPNPHDSHMADVQCSACHRWKGASRLMCSDCHSFPELQKVLETR